jgi:hypothetical protein
MREGMAVEELKKRLDRLGFNTVNALRSLIVLRDNGHPVSR